MSTQIPVRNTVVSYAYTIKNSAGTPIGTLQGFNPSANRVLERVRELKRTGDNQDTYEIVPGRTDFSIAVDRIETYADTLMSALGITDLEHITNATNPIQITEEVIGPLGQTRTIHYENCWVQSWSKTIREGTVTVTENVTLQPERIRVS